MLAINGKPAGDMTTIPVSATPCSLAVFEATRQQIAEACTVDQVKQILAYAVGLAAAARKATNQDLEAEAEILKLEAERKLGQLMAAQRETVGLHKGGRPKTGVSETPVSDQPIKLAEAGIDKNLAKRARFTARLSETEFEAAKEAARGAVHKVTRRRRKKSPRVRFEGTIDVICNACANNEELVVPPDLSRAEIDEAIKQLSEAREELNVLIGKLNAARTPE
jgi:hypothetical protein